MIGFDELATRPGGGGEGLSRLIATYGESTRSDTVRVPLSEITRGSRISMVSHRPDCSGYRAMALHNIVEFDSVEVAQDVGFKLVANCPH